MKKRTLRILSVTLIFILMLFSFGTLYAARPVIIAELNWAGSTAVCHVMKYVLENKLNVPAKIQALAAAVIWPGMDKGTVDVYSDLWMPNQEAGVKKYVEGRKTVELSLSFGNAPQAWYIPTQIAKKYNIYTYQDLSKNSKLFDITGDGKGDIWAGGFGWMSAEITKIQLRDLNVNLDTFIVEQWVFLTQLKEAVRKGTPYVFYYWAPNAEFSIYDLTEIKLPPYSDAKWKYVEKHPEQSKITCGWRPAQVYVGFSKKLAQKSQKAYKFFKQWHIPMDEVNFLIAEILDVPGNPKKDPASVAKKWVESHPDIVNSWIK